MRIRPPTSLLIIPTSSLLTIGVTALVGAGYLIWHKKSADSASSPSGASPVTTSEFALIQAYPRAAPVASRVISLAEKLATNPNWLANVVNFESGWDPAAVGASGATGLIQFYPGSTDVALGTTVQALRRMSMPEQWNYVEKYFLGGGGHGSFAGKLKSQLDVFMAVYWPSAVGKGPGYTFPSYTWDKNPGIKTAQDYYNKAMSKARLPA